MCDLELMLARQTCQKLGSRKHFLVIISAQLYAAWLFLKMYAEQWLELANQCVFRLVAPLVVQAGMSQMGFKATKYASGWTTRSSLFTLYLEINDLLHK